MPYLTPPEALDALLPDQPRYRANQLRRWLYETPVLDASEMSNLPGEVRSALADRLYPFTVEQDLTGDDGTTKKWLFRSRDESAVAYEAVLMGYPDRTTLCISSQAGCALACTFCATGQFGFDRHLEAGEIYSQIAFARAYLRLIGLPGCPDRLTNIVFMGMGEPLVNYARVRESLRRIIDVQGMSARSITVSTVGVVPGIDRLAAEPWPVRLAISLHAADDDLRSRLVPLNRRYPLSELIAAAERYFAAKGRRVSLEWTLMDGVNDTDDQAQKLAAIARRLGAHVNLIGMNPTPLSDDRPSRRVDEFADMLRDAGANATVRTMRGLGIDAACGQLRARETAPPEIDPSTSGGIATKVTLPRRR